MSSQVTIISNCGVEGVDRIAAAVSRIITDAEVEVYDECIVIDDIESISDEAGMDRLVEAISNEADVSSFDLTGTLIRPGETDLFKDINYYFRDGGMSVESTEWRSREECMKEIDTCPVRTTMVLTIDAPEVVMDEVNSLLHSVIDDVNFEVSDNFMIKSTFAIDHLLGFETLIESLARISADMFFSIEAYFNFVEETDSYHAAIGEFEDGRLMVSYSNPFGRSSLGDAPVDLVFGEPVQLKY